MTKTTKLPTTLEVELTLIEPMLGTTSGNKELAEEFIASKHPSGEVQSDEMEAIDRTLEDELIKASTIFPRDAHGRPFVWDYQIKGFFKDAASMLRRVKDGPKNEKPRFIGSLSSKLTSHKKVIDGLIFVYPRQIAIMTPDYDPNPAVILPPLEVETRPIRVQTAKGERVAIARSERVPAGTKLRLAIEIMNPAHKPYVIEWLDYGKKRGLGQWRNSGMGRFVYSIISDSSAE